MLQKGLPSGACALSAGFHACACTVACLGNVPVAPPTPATLRSLLTALLPTLPHSAFLATLRQAVAARTHQRARLRLALSSAAAQPQVRAALLFALMSAATTAAQAGGQHHVRSAFEAALAGTSTIDLAQHLTEARATSGNADDGALRLNATTQDTAAYGELSAIGATVPLRASPCLWGAYQQFLLSIGAVSDARVVLLRAVAACPWCQSLWVRGVHALASVLPGRQAAELLEAMQERGVPLLTLPAELLLERLEAEGDL